MDLVQVAIFARCFRRAEAQRRRSIAGAPYRNFLSGRKSHWRGAARRAWPARCSRKVTLKSSRSSRQSVYDGSANPESALPRKASTSVIPAIVRHHKWSITYNVRLALVRHPFCTARHDSFLPSELTVSDLRELAAPGIVPGSLRKYLQAEVQRRMRASEKTASGNGPAKDPSASNRE